MPQLTRGWKKWLVGEFTLRRLVRSLIEVYLCILVWAWLFSDRIAFQPPAPGYAEGNGVYRISSRDGTPIAVLALTNRNPTATVLYVHGNAEDIGGVRDLLEVYRDAGFDVFTFDYRGYGISGGKPTTRHSCDDIDSVYNHLLNVRGVEPQNLIVHGRSLGAAVALHLATRRPVGGVILESPFLTAFRARTQIRLSPFDKMRNDREIRRLKRPVLVIHGEEDTTIRTWQGRKLYALASEPKFCLWIERAGHDDVPAIDEKEYFAEIRVFADFVMSEMSEVRGGQNTTRP
ncbi:MAG: hypothetical protein BWK77_05635 [Verrucomicrobia bacterium A1]|nr:MAG: hypothetical protein BWK77_05635 [Verrucomicrobia bacterium A1]